MNEINKAVRLSELTYKEIARQLGITVGHLWRLRKGISYPSPKLARKISMLLNIPMEKIYENGGDC